jgi:hypothetical protein
MTTIPTPNDILDAYTARAEIHVSEVNGDDDYGDGSYRLPFATEARAADFIRRRLEGQGDIIRIVDQERPRQ